MVALFGLPAVASGRNTGERKKAASTRETAKEVNASVIVQFSNSGATSIVGKR